MKLSVQSKTREYLGEQTRDELELIITASVPCDQEHFEAIGTIPTGSQSYDDIRIAALDSIDEQIEAFVQSITKSGSEDELIASSGADELVCDGETVFSEKTPNSGFQFKAHIRGEDNGLQRSFHNIVKTALMEPHWWILSRRADEDLMVWRFAHNYFVMGDD